MLQLTKRTDYGLVLLANLARQGPGCAPSGRELARETQLPLPMVNKILHQLTQAQLLESHRGVKGGYTLARPASAISLAAIIEALEGGVALTECSQPAHEDGHANCERETFCSIRSHTQQINLLVWNTFRRISLDQLVSSSPPSPAGDPLQAPVPIWISQAPAVAST